MNLSRFTLSAYLPTMLPLLLGALFFIHSLLLARQTVWTSYDGLHTAERSRQMLVSGTLLTVKRNYFPDHRKPPLHYWLTALALKAVPDVRLALAFWPAFFGAASIALLGILARLLQPGHRWLPAWASACLATSFLLIHNSTVPLLDTGMVAFLLLTMAGYEAARTRPNAWWLVGAGIALGFLQKIPLGLLYLPLAVLADLLTHTPLPSLRCPAFRRSAAVWASLALIWPLHEFLIYGSKFWKRFIETEMFHRAATDRFLDRISAWETPVLIWEKWPYISLLAAASLFLLPFFHQKKETARLLAPALFLVFYVLFMMLTPMGKERYLLPIYPLIALFAAWTLHQIPGPAWLRFGCAGPLLLSLSFHNAWQQRTDLLMDRMPKEARHRQYTPLIAELGAALRDLRQPKETAVVFVKKKDVWYFYSGLAFFSHQPDPLIFLAPSNQAPQDYNPNHFDPEQPILLLAKPADLASFPDLFPESHALRQIADFTFYRAKMGDIRQLWLRPL